MILIVTAVNMSKECNSCIDPTDDVESQSISSNNLALDNRIDESLPRKNSQPEKGESLRAINEVSTSSTNSKLQPPRSNGSVNKLKRSQPGDTSYPGLAISSS